MTIEELKNLYSDGSITDITLISYYKEHEDELTSLTVQDVLKKGYIEKIGLAVEASKTAPTTPVTYTFEIIPNPADAVVKLNGIVQNKITVQSGEKVSWEVSKEGYNGQAGIEEITESIIKNINLTDIPVINPPVEEPKESDEPSAQTASNKKSKVKI